MRRHSTYALALALALAVAAPALGGGDEARKREVDARIAELRSAIDRFQSRQGVLTTEISAVTGKIRLLLKEVGDVSARLERLEAELAAKQARIDELNETIRKQTERLRFLRHEHDVAVERLNRRVVDIYISGEPDALSVVLAAASMSEVVEQLDYLKDIGVHDKRVIRQVAGARVEMRAARERTRRARAEVAEVARAIARRLAEQRRLRSRLLASQAALTSARIEKRAALTAVAAHESHTAHEIESLQEVSEQLAIRINAAQAPAAAMVVTRAASAAPAAAAPSSTPSAAGFIWPVSGPVTSGFGWRWGRMHEGVDIGAGSGTPIVAAAAGTVISAGWMGGYGNLVVVDHGNGIATAYAHLSGFAVAYGQAVAQGSVLGYVGCTGHCFGDHLHFEVRVHGAAVDPLGYL